MTREDYINTLELDNAELRKENEELKSQLRGTTHCFDEEEHKKLKEEITNLSKDVDMWNAKYNDMFDENRMLKKHLKVPKACNLKTLEDYKSYYEDTTREQILEDTYIEYCAYVNLAHRYSKLKKQLEEYQLQNIDLRADIMIQKQAIPNKLIKDKTFYDLYDMPTYEDLLTQQKEFIKFLEDEIKLYENDIQNFSKDYKAYFLLINDLKVSKSKMEEILNKYKEIVNGSKRN